MASAIYGEFIEDCRRERASLIGLIETLESGMLGPGQPLTVPDILKEQTEAVLASMDRMVADLDALITAYEANERG